MKRRPAPGHQQEVKPTPETEASGPRIEFWQGGQVASRNIGPARGDHQLGSIDGPGLYFFIAENAAGKSQHLALLSRLQDERLLRQDVNITHGELSAFFQIASTKVTFRRSATGQAREPKMQGMEDLPRIESLPAPIDDLITAGNFDGPEPRARHRLRALLSYAPIEATDDLARELCEAAADITELRMSSYRDAWDALCDEIGSRQKRFKALPYATPAEIESWIVGEPREGILEDHKMLAGRLNALGNVAEKAHAVQLERVSGLRGGLEGVLTAAGATEDQMSAAPDTETAEDEHRQASEAAAIIQSEIRRADEEQERHDRLRLGHGERPDLERAAGELAEARTALDRASQAEKAASDETRAAERAADLATRQVEAASGGLPTLYAEWLDAGKSIELAIGVKASPALPASAIDFDRLVRATEALREKVEGAAETVERRAGLLSEVKEHRATLQLRGEDVAAARRRFETAQAAHAERELAVGAWDMTESTLAAGINRPDADAVAAAEQRVERARSVATLARSKDSYQAEAARLEAAEQLADWLEEVGKDYREAAKATWDQLAAILTRSLGLPWLAVEGLDIVLYYDTETRRLATAETPDARREKRSIDDTDALSTAELHDACLSLMLSRREKLGGILIVPWQVMAALDEARLARFSERAEAVRLVVFSERPRRSGDPDELVLEKVQAKGGAL